MCKFFSFVSNGRGKYFYFDEKQREELKTSDYSIDSHTSIIKYYKKKGLIANKKDIESQFNKYEFIPNFKDQTI